MTQKYPDAQRVALFTGSFNPFTVGHASIVDRGLTMFDRIIIAVGVNMEKHDASDIARRLEEIKRVYAGDPRVAVQSYSGLTADLVVATGACCILKGVRNCTDFEYESNMAEVNRRLCGVETILLPSLPEYQSVSSSLVRELSHYGRDISEFLP